MKDIEDKLDGFEQVLAILVNKISMLESQFALWRRSDSNGRTSEKFNLG